MFFFQLPWLPELLLASTNFGFLDECFRGSVWGVKNRAMITAEDVEVYKHALHSWGEVTHCVDSTWCYELTKHPVRRSIPLAVDGF